VHRAFADYNGGCWCDFVAKSWRYHDRTCTKVRL
jgi:hypothetical protein